MVFFLILLLALAPPAISATAPPPPDEPIEATGNETNTSRLVSSSASSNDEVYSQTGPRPLESGESYWRGWHVTFNATAIIPNPHTVSEQNRTFQIRRATNTNRIGERLTTFTVDRTGTHTIDTRHFKGSVVLLHNGEVVYVTNGTGYITNPPDNTTVTTATSRWFVPEQTLTPDWDDNPSYPTQLTNLTVTSNRESFTLGVKADGLSYRQLTEIFPADRFAENHAAHRPQGALLLKGNPTFQSLTNFNDLPPGQYDFEFYSTDARVSVNSTLRILEPHSDIQFESVQRSQQSGDIITATISCEQCYLLIGGPDDGVIELIELTDQNNDQTITLRINTRYAGLYLGHPGVPPKNISAYRAGPDDATRVDSSVLLDSRRALSKIRTRLGFDPHGRDAPLGPGLYDLTLTESTYLLNQPPRDSETLLVRDHTDIATVRLTDPSLDSIESYTAPPGLPRDLSLENIPTRSTPRDVVVIGDQLLFKIDISGLFGYLNEEHANHITGLIRNQDEGLSLQITGQRFIAPTRSIDLQTSRTRLLTDPENNALYVAIDTRHLRPTSLTTEQPFTATLRVTGIPESRPRYSLTTPEANHRGYPYLLPGRQTAVKTTVQLRSPTNTATVNDQINDRLETPNDFEVPISGETLVAPGSRLTITATQDSSHEWETKGTAIVQPDGTWQTSIDYSQARPGQTFTLTVQQQSRTLTTTDGVIVESTDASHSTLTPTPTPSPTETTTTSSPSPTDTPTEGTPAPEVTPPDTEPPQESPTILNSLLPNPPALTGTIGLIVLILTGLSIIGIAGSTGLALFQR